MKHYWILGLFGVAVFGYSEYVKGDLWFQHHGRMDAVMVHEDASDDDFEWSGVVGAGQLVEVKGVNGRVYAERTSGSDVEVRAHKEGRRSEPSTVRVQMVEHAKGLTFCAVYPSRRNDNVCVPGDGGSLGADRNDVKVDFTVLLPEGVSFVGKTVNGGVKALDLTDDVVAKTVNGSIEVSTGGAAEASSVNGSIKASMGRTDWEGELDFKTVNGSITVTLPEGVSAEFSGATMNGSITSEFPLTISGKFGPRKLTGLLGDGGGAINLESMNGSIRILRGN